MFKLRKKAEPLVISGVKAREVEVVETHKVTWLCRKQDGFRSHGAVVEEYEVFFSREEADKFADDLRTAYKLLRTKDYFDVKVETK